MQNIRRTVRRTTFFIEIVFLLEVFKKILSESSNKKIITKPETWYNIRIENFYPVFIHPYVCLKNTTITVEVIAIISAN